MQIYVQHGGQQLGPFTEAEVKAQLATGVITPQDHVWWQGQADWILLSASPFVTAPLPGAPAEISIPAIPPTPGIPAPEPTATGAAAPTSKLPLWALICGCLGFFCSIFASIPAIILGHMSLSRIKKNPGMPGHGMAMAGLIMGYIFTAMGVVVIPIVAISVLIALGNQVKAVNENVQAQIQSAGATNSDQTITVPDQSATNADQSTNAPAAVSPDQSTNSDQSTNAAPSTNSTDSSSPATNSPAAGQ